MLGVPRPIVIPLTVVVIFLSLVILAVGTTVDRRTCLRQVPGRVQGNIRIQADIALLTKAINDPGSTPGEIVAYQRLLAELRPLPPIHCASFPPTG